MTALAQVSKHSKGTNSWRNRSVVLVKPFSNIFEILWKFSFRSLARCTWKGTLYHQHPSYAFSPSLVTLAVPSSALPILAAYCCSLCTRSIQQALHHFQHIIIQSSPCASQPHTQSAPTGDADILMAAQKTSLFRLPIDCHLWALQYPLFSPVIRSKLLWEICCFFCYIFLPISHHLLLLSCLMIETDMRFLKHWNNI